MPGWYGESRPQYSGTPPPWCLQDGQGRAASKISHGCQGVLRHRPVTHGAMHAAERSVRRKWLLVDADGCCCAIAIGRVAAEVLRQSIC